MDDASGSPLRARWRNPALAPFGLAEETTLAEELTAADLPHRRSIRQSRLPGGDRPAPMRRAVATIVVTVLLVSCSGGGSNDAAPDTLGSPSVVDNEQTEHSADDAETDPPSPAGDSALDQLAAFAATDGVDGLDVALAELSTYVGPIPGVPTLQVDDSIFPSLTHVLDEIDAGRSQLTSEQAEVVDAAIAALFPPDQITDEFPLFVDSDGEPEGFAPPGLASPATEPPFEDAPPEVRAAIRSAGEAVRSYLGGPALNIWVQTFPPGAIGDVAGRNTGLRPEDPRREALPGNPDCIIKVATGATPGDIAGIITHEVTHCWQFTRMGVDVDRWNATGEWVREGQAAFIGHELGGLTRYNEDWWRFYLSGRIDGNGQWPMYASSYDAIGFWSRVAAGSDVVAAMRRTVDASPSDSRMFTAATSELGGELSWLGAGTFQRADWGGGWTASTRGDPGTPRRSTSHTVIERNDVALSADAGAQANYEIDVSPVGGADGSVVTAQGRGTGVLRVDPIDVVLSGSFSEEWCIGECLCPDGAPAFPPDRVQPAGFTISASIVGLPAEETTLGVKVARFDDEDPGRCDEEPDPSPEPAGDGDISGLVGTWRADPNSVALAFERASSFGGSAVGIEVIGADGDVLITFDEGGTGSLAYVGVTLYLADEIIGDLTLNGSGTFTWSISGSSVVISGTDYAISVTSSALGGELLTLTDEDVPATGTTSLSGAVAGDTLTVTSADGSEGTVFFPISWQRQE